MDVLLSGFFLVYGVGMISVLVCGWQFDGWFGWWWFNAWC